MSRWTRSTPTSRPSGQGCDEFPNHAMVGSGPPAQFDANGNFVDITNTSLRVMVARSNSLEGTRYGQFTDRCAPTVKVARLPFLIVPMTGPASPPSSRAVCPFGGGGEL